MEFKWLEDFIALKDLKNFSAAAKSRFVTQSAFSRRIQALEVWIGVPLFDRTSYPIELTEDGVKFIPYVEELINAVNNTKNDFSQIAKRSKNHIRIDCLHSFAINLLPRAFGQLPDYFAKFNISLNPSIQGLDNQFQSLLDDTSDFLFTYNTAKIRPEILIANQLESVIVSQEKVVAVIAPSLLEQFEHCDTVSYLAYAPQTFLYNLIEPLVKSSPKQLKQVFEATLSESLVKMAVNGAGLTWAPWHAVEQELMRGTLIPVFTKDNRLTTTQEVICYKLVSNQRAAVSVFWNGLQNLDAKKIYS